MPGLVNAALRKINESLGETSISHNIPAPELSDMQGVLVITMQGCDIMH